jgi:hypothetical protein
MSEVGDYREHAERARQLAAAAEVPAIRETMLRVAAQYDQLATQAAHMEEQRRRLQQHYREYLEPRFAAAKPLPSHTSPDDDAVSARDRHPEGRVAMRLGKRSEQVRP